MCSLRIALQFRASALALKMHFQPTAAICTTPCRILVELFCFCAEE